MNLQFITVHNRLLVSEKAVKKKIIYTICYYYIFFKDDKTDLYSEEMELLHLDTIL